MGSEDRYCKTYSISWEKIHQDCKSLAERLHGMGRWERIVGIARGGLVPTAIVAQELVIILIE